MKKILLSCLCVMTYTFAEIDSVATPLSFIDQPKVTKPVVRPLSFIDQPDVTEPIVRPAVRPIRPIRPRDRPVRVREYYNYNTNVISSCDEYIRIIEEKDHEIDGLKKEIESLKAKEHTKFQKNLRTEYEQELKKFDERKSGIKTKNRIDVSDK